MEDPKYKIYKLHYTDKSTGDADLLAKGVYEVIEGENIYINGTQAVCYIGKIVEVIPATRTVYVLVTHGQFDISKTGASYNSEYVTFTLNSTDYIKQVSTYTQPSLKNYSGDILYVDNIDPVVRSSTTQKIKLVIEF